MEQQVNFLKNILFMNNLFLEEVNLGGTEEPQYLPSKGEASEAPS